MIHKTVLDFKLKKSDEKITARSGLALFSEFLCSLKIPNLVNRLMPEGLSNHSYQAWDYIHSLLLTLYGGGESCAETREIREDNALKVMCNIDKVPSESATGDWLKRMGLRDGDACLKTINKETLADLLQRNNITEVTLVNDPSIIKSEKRDARMTYEGYKGYRPAMIFIQELGFVVHYEFRHGNDNGQKYAFFKEVFDILPPGIKVKLVLMDAEFYEGEIFTLLLENKIDFAIAVSKDSAVMESINQIPQHEWKQCKDRDGFSLDRECAETVHIMNTCKIPFRLIVLRWKDPKNQNAYCYHGIGTGMENLPAQEVIWKYNSRSGDENSIKELKNGIGMRKMPSGDFKANAVYFGIGVLCYNLFIAQKILTMPKVFHRKTIKTIRWILIEVPGKIVSKAAGIIVKLATNNDKFNIFQFMRSKNYELLGQGP
jgi:hypothetical protein